MTPIRHIIELLQRQGSSKKHTTMQTQAGMNKSKKLVLLVEDDPNDILLFNKAIKQCEIDVNFVILRDGEEAISYLTGNGEKRGHPEPDLILLDVKLPRKSGFEVLEWIKQHPSLQITPVIILSSSKETRDLKTAYELGANSYLVKPTGFDDLNELVNDLWCYWLVHNQTLNIT